MPFFKKNSKTELEAPAPSIGNLPCTEDGCISVRGVACQYVDRRGRACDTAWCPEHRLVVAGNVYCRRHGGASIALKTDIAPDLDNRAPSLASWVCRDISEEMSSRIAELAKETGFTPIIAPVSLVHHGVTVRTRSWEAAWKLTDHTGIHLSVVVEVRESQPDTVIGKVNNEVVFQAIPPWIRWRKKDLSASDSQRAVLRQEFYDHMVEVLIQNAQKVL